MKFLKKPIIIIAIILLGTPLAGYAQYQFQVNPFFSYFKDLGRYELGFNYGAYSSGEFEGVVPHGGLGAGLGDTNVKISINSVNYGGSIGLSVPFKATGHISVWAMDFSIMGHMYTWTDLNQTYSTDGSFKKVTPALEANTLQIALPIGVEWKVGCDAICTKRLPFCASAGAGFIPQYNITTLTNVNGVNAGNSFGCTPYLKAEVGENAFMCAKLRFTYTLGNVTLIDVNHRIVNITDGPFKITSTSNFYISLILMPFSVGWKERAWWNTHDTYNLQDKLN